MDEKEIAELQSRMAAVELLLTNLLTHAVAVSPAFGARLDGLIMSNELIRAGMKKSGEDITLATHYRFLECVANLIAEARRHSGVFALRDD